MAVDIPRLRLRNQQIAAPQLTTPGDVVAHLGAVQAQDYLGSLWAIGLRVPGATEASVEEAVAARTIVRTWPMRGTLHFVAADDVRWMLRLLAARVTRGLSGRHRQLGLDARTFARSRRLLVRHLEGGGRLTRDAVHALLRSRGIDTSGARGLHIVGTLAQEGLICFGPRQGKQQTFVLLDEWLPATPTLERDEALATLARRYFTSHGPATASDLAWWSGLPLRDVRLGLELARNDLVRESIGGVEYWHARSEPAKSRQRAHLLPPFDEYTVAYRDRSAVLDPAFAKHAAAGGVFRPLIVIDGRVAGTWRRSFVKQSVQLAFAPFAPLGKSHMSIVDQASERYARFLGVPLTSAP